MNIGITRLAGTRLWFYHHGRDIAIIVTDYKNISCTDGDSKDEGLCRKLYSVRSTPGQTLSLLVGSSVADFSRNSGSAVAYSIRLLHFPDVHYRRVARVAQPPAQDLMPRWDSSGTEHHKVFLSDGRQSHFM
ncbi:Hypothetical protein NTJ_05104 [Nesidiocoris tenuis]|uniref:Uncharacterized protein n=1 Tax=Nesidiocoris tenuis TaxID=355587 RepID=A0ABN7AN34_9HEMI|nr:Hypothetical protein NTJ_05104 [Nesidiocoris tenuis]